MKDIYKAIISTIALLSILALLFCLRMIPAVNNKVEFVLDCAFHYRMTEDVVNNGNVPKIDALSTYPQGKEIRTFLPTGMYHACALFHTTLNRFKAAPLPVSILLFCSFCGSMIAIPVYLISCELYHNRFIGLATAFLAGIIPAYLNRTICYWYRYEVLAMPILFTALLFFIKAFKSRERKNILIYSAASALFMIAGFYVWRLTVLFATCCLLSVVYISAKGGEHSKKALMIFFALFCIYVAFALFLPGFGLKNPGSDYGGFPKAVIQISLQKMGLRQNFSEFTRLVLDNQELSWVGIGSMFSWQFLSFSGVFIILYILFYFTSKTCETQKDVILVFLLFFLILTFFASRNKVVLGPLAALSGGETMAILADKKRERLFKYIMLSVIIIAAAKTGIDSYKLASTRYVNTKLRPYLKEALAAIDKRTPPDSVIHCYWADGYPIQTYCRRPTLTDGLFESPEIVKRIMEESRAIYSYNEDELWGFCRRYGATHVLVPIGRKLSYAHQAGVDYRKYYGKKGPTTLGRLTILFKLMYLPGELKKFYTVYRNNEYVLYALVK